MKAVTWHGQRDVRVEEVPDPFVQEPTDAVIRVTTTNICGSDLHLYEPLAPFLGVGNILGHENMGQVVEVGSECGDLEVGDRASIAFQISCGHCWMRKPAAVQGAAQARALTAPGAPTAEDA
jgi:threonine dehydrogenase-like Zn-dependent dehydrogenase